jgi:hypothetical protein
MPDTVSFSYSKTSNKIQFYIALEEKLATHATSEHYDSS